MICIDYISSDGDTHYYYHIWKDNIRIGEFKGEAYELHKKLNSLKSEMVIQLFEDFILTDKEILDRGKNSSVYTDKINRCKAFVDWAIENKLTAPESIVNNGLISVKFLISIISMINVEHPKRKDLIFIKYCIEQTCKNKIEWNQNQDQ